MKRMEESLGPQHKETCGCGHEHHEHHDHHEHDQNPAAAGMSTMTTGMSPAAAAMSTMTTGMSPAAAAMNIMSTLLQRQYCRTTG